MSNMHARSNILARLLFLVVPLTLVLAACGQQADLTSTLSVSLTGDGAGTITSASGIDCGSDCDEELDNGTSVTLTAQPAAGSTFVRWGGACEGKDTACNVTVNADTAVSAWFALDTSIQTATFTIQSSSDDAEEFQSNVNASFPAGTATLTSSDIDMTWDTGFSSSVVVGLRYSGVALPNGAGIMGADLTFTKAAEGAGSLTYTIEGQDSDNAGTFVYDPASFDISSRTTTSASATWQVNTPWVGPTETTADLSDIVQEIVDRGGWMSGNALAFIITSDGDASNYNVAGSFDDATPGNEAQLTVRFVAP